MRKLLVGLTLSTVFSCEGKFDYSPYAIDFNEDEKQIHQKNVKKLDNLMKTADTIRIALTGDSHRFYDQLEEGVLAINSKNSEQTIDFLLHTGDLTDFGLPRQYQWGNSILQKLDIPYFVTAGNHDLIGNGLTAYNEMFGPLDFSFVFRNLKVISLNTNSREFCFDGFVPDLIWLDTQLRPNNSFNVAIVLFHVPPGDADFDASLENDFQRTLAKYNNVLFTLHGHIHDYQLYIPFNDSIPYLNSYGIEHMKFNLIKIIDHEFKIETFGF